MKRIDENKNIMRSTTGFSVLKHDISKGRADVFFALIFTLVLVVAGCAAGSTGGDALDASNSEDGATHGEGDTESLGPDDDGGDDGGGVLELTLSASPAAGVAPLPVSLRASPSGGAPPYQISWDFGDGESGSGAELRHVFAQGGSYVVKVTAVDSQGAVGSAETAVVVEPLDQGIIPLGVWAETQDMVADQNGTVHLLWVEAGNAAFYSTLAGNVVGSPEHVADQVTHRFTFPPA